jgi:hypothetical protein
MLAGLLRFFAIPANIVRQSPALGIDSLNAFDVC